MSGVYAAISGGRALALLGLQIEVAVEASGSCDVDYLPPASNSPNANAPLLNCNWSCSMVSPVFGETCSPSAFPYYAKSSFIKFLPGDLSIYPSAFVSTRNDSDDDERIGSRCRQFF